MRPSQYQPGAGAGGWRVRNGNVEGNLVEPDDAPYFFHEIGGALDVDPAPEGDARDKLIAVQLHVEAEAP